MTAFAPTAASSPTIHGIDTPEVEPLLLEPPQLVQATDSGGPAQAEYNIDPSIAIPVYRLPSKPFLVQALPKVPSGFAPSMPLDKTRAPVRRWRKAQRVIRGIAGGQWVASSWVGEKDSAYASATGRAPAENGENAIPASALSAALSVKGKERPSAAATAPSSGVASPALSMPKLPPLPGAPRGAPIGKSRLGERIPINDGDSGGGLMVGGMSTANSSRSGSAVAPNNVEPFFANGGFSAPMMREPSSMSRQDSFEGENSEPPPQMPIREIDEMYD